MSSVKCIHIWSNYTSEISSHQLAKLVSIVRNTVDVDDLPPVCQLGPILASVQSTQLLLQDMSLSEENTRALVTAMRDRVQTVSLYYVFLDPELLSDYDGQGHCTELEMHGNMVTRYGARMREWAGERGWTVTLDRTGHGLWTALKMERK